MPRMFSNRFTILAACALLLMGMAAILRPTPVVANGDDYNRPGNILISDQFNNRVIEVEPDGGIVWQWAGAAQHADTGDMDAESARAHYRPGER